MESKISIEWAPFRLQNGVTESELFEVAKALNSGFLSNQDGFISRDLVKISEGRYADIVKWESIEHAEKAMEASMSSEICQRYFKVLVPENTENPVSHYPLCINW